MRHFFLRDEQRFPVACVASAIRRPDGTLGDGPLELDSCIAWSISIFNPRDDYNRARAVEIAEGRLRKGKFSVLRKPDVPGLTIKWGIVNEIADGNIPSHNLDAKMRLQHAALLWLGRFDERAKALEAAKDNDNWDDVFVPITPAEKEALLDSPEHGDTIAEATGGDIRPMPSCSTDVPIVTSSPDPASKDEDFLNRMFSSPSPDAGGC